MEDINQIKLAPVKSKNKQMVRRTVECQFHNCSKMVYIEKSRVVKYTCY